MQSPTSAAKETAFFKLYPYAGRTGRRLNPYRSTSEQMHGRKAEFPE